jgi:hypothetical protein
LQDRNQYLTNSKPPDRHPSSIDELQIFKPGTKSRRIAICRFAGLAPIRVDLQIADLPSLAPIPNSHRIAERRTEKLSTVVSTIGRRAAMMFLSTRMQGRR